MGTLILCNEDHTNNRGVGLALGVMVEGFGVYVVKCLAYCGLNPFHRENATIL